MLKLAILCGGPSGERGVSLNSARSFLDHTSLLDVELTVLYVDPKGIYYKLTPAQLYSNTPSDFDFKLSQTSVQLSEASLISLLSKMDLVLPLIHGAYGEDGSLQAFFEFHRIPFVGSPSEVCRQGFNKYRAQEILKKNGFSTAPCLLIQSKEAPQLEIFWRKNKLKLAVVKPTNSGSSIGVKLVDSLESARQAVSDLWEEGFHELMAEPFCEDAQFTICVFENKEGKPVSLIPSEIDIGSGIFDYRKKYLFSDQKRYFCPPRFTDAAIQEIRKEAERFFTVLGLRDYARIDGWLSADGKVRFSDLNPYSGMEQNSFIFQQATRVGISHSQLIAYVLESALKRLGKPQIIGSAPLPRTPLQKVFVLMGGLTSERQVSLMSGTNVWLKLIYSDRYEPIPFLMDQKIWKLPYGFTLHHTVSEMVEHCERAESLLERTLPFLKEIRAALGLPPIQTLEAPQSMDLDAFIAQAKKENAFVFIALHGGMGEDGTLQKKLEAAQVLFNGSGSLTSHICMDKRLTAQQIRNLKNSDVLGMDQISFTAKDWIPKREEEIESFWKNATQSFGTEDLIVKPQCDGCSTGVVRIRSGKEFLNYIDCLRKGLSQIPKGMFREQNSPIEMPPSSEQHSFLLEPFIHTDKIHIKKTELVYNLISGWCEMTLGVMEKGGGYIALHPSITVAENHVLSVEEKFQSGTGVNITPPPKEILSASALKKVQEGACKAARALGIKNYARFDLFVELATGKIRIIEVNSLPALTPSTVLYHQALSQSPPIPPRQLLTEFIENAKVRTC